MAWARTVAVVVPSPATSDVFEATSLTSWAPMFSQGSLSSTSLATVTPSLVLLGEPNFFSRMMFFPRGPSVAFTRLLRMLTPTRRECLASSPVVICLAMFLSFPLPSLDLRQDLFFAQDHVLDVIDGDFGAAVLADEDPVPFLDLEGNDFAFIIDPALARGDDLGLLGLLFGGVRDDDASLLDFPFFQSL